MACGTKLFSALPEQHFHRGTVAVHGRVVAQHGHIAQRQPLHLQVPAAGTDQHASRQQQVARLRFLHADRASLVQSPGKHFGETFRHVLHDQDGAGKIRRQLREHVLQGVRTAGRNANDDDLRGDASGYRIALCGRLTRLGRLGTGTPLLCAAALILAISSAAISRHALRDVLRLGDEIERAQRQRLQRDRRAVGCCGS